MSAAPASKGKPGVIQVVADAANAIVVAADAAEAIATTTALPSSGTAGRAAAVVSVVRWLAQVVNWLLVVLRLRKGAATKP